MQRGPLPSNLAAIELQDPRLLHAFLDILFVSHWSAGQAAQGVLVVDKEPDFLGLDFPLVEFPRSFLDGVDLAVFDVCMVSDLTRALEHGGRGVDGLWTVPHRDCYSCVSFSYVCVKEDGPRPQPRHPDFVSSRLFFLV